MRELPEIGSAPKQTTCLSISLTKVTKALVGAKLAPDKALKATALSVPNESALVSQ